MARSLIIDTDTAGDDAQAILMGVLAESVDVEAVTIVAGNVPFEDEVANAKYTLQLADAAGDVPVYEGVDRPLLKDFEHVEYVHGEGGLGGEIFPDTGIESAEGHAVDAIVEIARESPGEVSLACIGPLTNVALALRHEPDLGNLLDEVIVMGGAVNTLGNDRPSAEFNFWVDPDAAKAVVNELDVTLVDWGLTVRQGTLPGSVHDDLADVDSPYADFFVTTMAHAREYGAEQLGEDSTTHPDAMAMACWLNPDIVTEAETYFVDVDEREGMTRGYSMVDERGITDGEPRTEVVEAIDEDTFRRMMLDMLEHGEPERSL